MGVRGDAPGNNRSPAQRRHSPIVASASRVQPQHAGSERDADADGERVREEAAVAIFPLATQKAATAAPKTTLVDTVPYYLETAVNGGGRGGLRRRMGDLVPGR